MTINYSKQVLLKRGNTAVSSTYTGPVGEITLDTDLLQLRVHDGTTQGGWVVPSGQDFINIQSNLAVISNVDVSLLANVSTLLANANSQQTQIDSLISGAIDLVTVGNSDPNTANETFWFNNDDGRLYIKQENVWTDASPTLLPTPSYITSIMEDFEGNIVPAANVTYSLGTQQAQWKDLWVSNNTIYIGNTPITVSNGSLLVGGNVVSGGGNTFNQNLNTTDAATFANVSATIGFISQINGTNPGGELVIQTNGIHNWNFTANGELTFPGGNITIASNIGGSTDAMLGSANAAVGVIAQGESGSIGLQWIENGVSNAFGSNVAGVVVNSPAGSTPGTVQILTGNIGGSQYTWEFGADGVTTLPGNIGSTQASGLTVGSNYNVRIVADQIDSNHTWTFGTDGSLTMPNGAKIGLGDAYQFATDNTVVTAVDMRDTSGRGFYTDSNGYTLRSSGEKNWGFGTTGILTLPSNSYVETTDANLTVGSQGTVTIRANAATVGGTRAWTFGTDGILAYPDGTISTGGAVYAAANASVQLISNNENTQVRVDNSNVEIYTSPNGITQYQWTFGINGATVFPGNISVPGNLSTIAGFAFYNGDPIAIVATATIWALSFANPYYIEIAKTGLPAGFDTLLGSGAWTVTANGLTLTVVSVVSNGDYWRITVAENPNGTISTIATFNRAASGANIVIPAGGSINFSNGASILSTVGTYGNANVAEYLPTYTGNITAGNLTITGNLDQPNRGFGNGPGTDLYITAGHTQGCSIPGGDTIISGGLGYNGIAWNGGNVTLRTGDYYSKQWNFDYAGTLTLPGATAGETIATQSGYITVGNLLIGQGGALFNSNNDSWALYGNISDAGTAIFIPSNADAGNGIPLYLENQISNVEIRSGSSTWTFGTDGTTQFPGSKILAPVSESITMQSDQYSQLMWENANLTVAPNMAINSNFYVAQNSATLDIGYRDGNSTQVIKSWYWNADGIMTLPTAGRINFDNLSISSDANVSAFYAPAGNVQLAAGIGDAQIVASSLSDSKIWNFGANANLTLPQTGYLRVGSGIVAGFASSPAPVISGFSSISAQNFTFLGNGASILSNVVTKVSDSWTVTTGTNTYSFTVPTSGTYQLWVDCNIPNGILAWNATATVTNSNVPVVGAQYAWVYNGGGTPIDFVSIPNQFIGTANTIVRSNTAPSATTNRFDFGINNTSGGNVTMTYGYIKIS